MNKYILIGSTGHFGEYNLNPILCPLESRSIKMELKMHHVKWVILEQEINSPLFLE